MVPKLRHELKAPSPILTTEGKSNEDNLSQNTKAVSIIS